MRKRKIKKMNPKKPKRKMKRRVKINYHPKPQSYVIVQIPKILNNAT